MAALTWILVAAASPFADGAWLRVQSHTDCALEGITERVEQQLIGSRNHELEVDVELRRDAGIISVRLHIARGTETVGTKTLQVPSCDEALDGVATIIALALSSSTVASQAPPPAATPTARAARPSLRPHSSAVPPRGVASERDVATSPTHDGLEAEFAGAAGVDVGHLADPTAVVGAGAGVRADWGELKGVAWYGLPTTREEVSTIAERTRAEFFAVTVDYCRDLDRTRWLSLCGGLEASLARTTHTQKQSAEPPRVQRRLEPALAPSLSASLAYPEGRWVVPQLDLAVRAPLLAARDEARWGFRAAIGAALPF